MKKFFLSTFVFLASAGYVAYQYLGGGSATAAQSPIASVAQTTQTAVPSGQSGAAQVVTTTSPAPSATVASSQTQSSGAAATPASTQAPATTPVATPAPVPVTKQTGQYKDGTYTGSSADAYYGTVQVQAVVQGGKLVTVNFLQYPSDRSTSRYINGQAMPMLQTEAIQAQSASVSGVSGATDTSAAFVQSLGSALSQAANS
jgi:uncharacterized protein with FMN-binding domain